MSNKLTRRDFLRTAALGAAGVAVVACQPKTVIVKETVEVQKEVEKVVKETVVVEKEVEVQKEVTKVIEKEKVVTATPVAMQYNEAPTLAGLSQAGELSAVDERVGPEPLVLKPVEEINFLME